MWPWEHAAVGYLVYSIGLRALRSDPPSDREAILLLVITQLPDLVDKPFSWVFGVFSTGYALGHSVFVAVPIGAAVLIVSRLYGRVRLGVVIVVGYWTHLGGDVLNPLRSGGSVSPERVLWPVVSGTPYEEDLGASRGIRYVLEFVDSLARMDPLTLVGVYLLLPVATILIWIRDGTPGLGVLGISVDRWR